MSVEEVKRFAKDVKENESLLEEIKSAGTSVTDIAEFAKSKGYNFGADTLQSLVDEKKGELTEEELEKVSAGTDTVEVVLRVLQYVVDLLAE